MHFQFFFFLLSSSSKRPQTQWIWICQMQIYLYFFSSPLSTLKTVFFSQLFYFSYAIMIKLKFNKFIMFFAISLDFYVFKSIKFPLSVNLHARELECERSPNWTVGKLIWIQIKYTYGFIQRRRCRCRFYLLQNTLFKMHWTSRLLQVKYQQIFHFCGECKNNVEILNLTFQQPTIASKQMKNKKNKIERKKNK